MSIATELTRIQNAKSAIQTAITNKGVTVPDDTKLDEMAGLIDSIEAGGGGMPEEYISYQLTEDGIIKAVNVVGYAMVPDRLCYEKVTLTSATLSPDVIRIEEYAFAGCSSLARIELSDRLDSIKDRAFAGCLKLVLTEFPASVLFIGEAAFFNCKLLSAITFRGKPLYIGSTAFNNCTNLKTINVPWAEGEVAYAPWGATNATINYNYTG